MPRLAESLKLPLTVLALTLAMGLPGAPHAMAEPPSPQALSDARAAYNRGQELFRQNQFEAARASFERAYALAPNPVVKLSIAECQVREGRYADAVSSLESYLTERPNAKDRAQVEAQIGALRNRPAELIVESEPAGASIFVDGHNLEKTTPAELILAPGEHDLVLRLEGHRDGEQPLDLAFGSKQRISVILDPQSPPEEVPIAAETHQDEADRPRRAALFTTLAVSGAALATGAVLGGLALKSKKDFDAHPAEATADRGERLALFSDVAFGVAVAASAAALVLWLSEDDEAAPKTETALRWAPTAIPRGALLSGGWKF